jgi:hypothetical protein
MKSSIFWDITPCIPLKVNRHFGGTCHLHLQGRRKNQARNQRESFPLAFTLVSYLAYSFHAGSLLRLFFDPEDGDDMFLRNIG